MTVKEKQNLLAFLGLYTGKIDGIWGGGSKAAARSFQEKNGLPITGEIDQTTALLISEAVDAKIEDAFTATEPETDDVWAGIKYFTPDEFKCTCRGRGCDGFPAPISRTLLVLLDGIREHYGVPVTISSGVRCQLRNSELPGSAYNSRHLYGKAADFKVRGKSAKTVLAYVRTLPGVRYAYDIDGTYVHVDVY